MFGKDVRRIAAGRNANSARADIASTLDIGWRIANHNDIPAPHIDAEQLSRTTLRDRRQFRPQFMIGSIRADHEHLRIDADCLEFGSRTVDQIPGKKAECDIVTLRKRGEKVGHTWQRHGPVFRVAQLLAKTDHITIEQLLHARVDVLVVVADDAHQLSDDLRVGLPVEAMVRWSGVAEDLNQRAVDRTPTCAIG
jgi:hypothetical protein